MQDSLLDLLTEFDKICKEHGLRYSLTAGTLLGAVRHKGFIPWDDDVDVCMPRPDYEKFLKIIQEENVLPEYLTYSKDRGKGTYYCFTKILDKRYPLRTPNHIEVKYLYLDIFPVDGAADTKEERKTQFKKERSWVINRASANGTLWTGGGVLSPISSVSGFISAQIFLRRVRSVSER